MTRALSQSVLRRWCCGPPTSSDASATSDQAGAGFECERVPTGGDEEEETASYFIKRRRTTDSLSAPATPAAGTASKIWILRAAGAHSLARTSDCSTDSLHGDVVDTSLTREFDHLARLRSAGVNCTPAPVALLFEPTRRITALVQTSARGAPLAAANFFTSRGNLVAALRSIHTAGLVHADLKAEHLLVAPDGAIAIVDFDLACETGGSSSTADIDSCSENHAGHFRGTPPFAAWSTHLGGAPVPAADCESAVWIVLELLVQVYFPEWKLPWRINEPSIDALGAESRASDTPTDDQLFAQLFELLEAHSWGPASIHRAGKIKLDAIRCTGQFAPRLLGISPSEADTFFCALLQRIRPDLQRLLFCDDPHDRLARIFDTLANSVQSASDTTHTLSAKASASLQPSLSDDVLLAHLARHLAIEIAPATVASHTHRSSFLRSLHSASLPADAASDDATPSFVHLSAPSDDTFAHASPWQVFRVVVPDAHSAMVPHAIPEDVLATHSALCAQLVQVESQCDRALLRGWTIEDACTFLVVTLSAFFAEADGFFSALLASPLLFTLPCLHAAMQCDRLLLLLPHSTTMPLAPADETFGTLDVDSADAVAILLQATSDELIIKRSASDEPPIKRARIQS